MYICITTVYNSENCGSYWQAKTLGDYLQALGNDVTYLKRSRRGTSHGVAQVAYRAIQSMKSLNIKSFISVFDQYIIFSHCEKGFKTIPAITEKIDFNILGSDTIWNISSKYFMRNHETYWGGKFKAKKTISYAASIGNTEKSKFDEIDISYYINNMDSISVRDDFTKSLLEGYTNKKIEQVCDPTMLFDKEYYRQNCSLKLEPDFIFVYYFGQVPEQLQKSIRKYAIENGLRIIVMGHSMKGDIVTLSYSPYLFVEYFVGAKYVVTNTFHGTIFSINLEKQAVFCSENKRKIIDVLTKFQLTDHDYSINSDNYVFASTIDYSKVTPIKDEIVKESKSFIKKVIN